MSSTLITLSKVEKRADLFSE